MSHAHAVIAQFKQLLKGVNIHGLTLREALIGWYLGRREKVRQCTRGADWLISRETREGTSMYESR